MRVYSETLNTFRQKQQKRLVEIYRGVDAPELRAYKIRYGCPKLFIGRYEKNWLGSYCAKDNIIQLSEKLLTMKQETIDEVIKHELAHHFQRCKYGNKGHVHGSAFKEMCEYLRIEPSATMNIKEFNSQVKASAKEESLLKKVEKLFALGESPNEEEASSAIAKANQLIQKYNLDYVGKDTDELVQVTVYRGKTKASIVSAISSLVKELFDVHPVWGRFGDKVSLELNGSPEKVEVASYVFEFVQREVERFYKVARKKYGLSGRTAKINYIVSLLNEYRRNAKAQNETPEEEMTTEQKNFQNELVKSSEEEYRKVNKVIYEGRLVTTRSSGYRGHSGARNAGRNDSKNFSINKGVKSGGGQKLLA